MKNNVMYKKRKLHAMKSHLIQCSCGEIQGSVDFAKNFSHIICYCRDCQAYARYFDNKDSIMDESGGTEIIQVSPSTVQFTKGTDQIAVVRLTEKGMMRWYAKCCDTPIGNTTNNYKQSFIGLIHNCLTHQNIETSFGKPHSLLNTKSALGTSLSKDKGVLKAIIKYLSIVLSSRFNGQYKINPFFINSGQPIVKPIVLDQSELERLKNIT